MRCVPGDPVFLYCAVHKHRHKHTGTQASRLPAGFRTRLIPFLSGSSPRQTWSDEFKHAREPDARA